MLDRSKMIFVTQQKGICTSESLFVPLQRFESCRTAIQSFDVFFVQCQCLITVFDNLFISWRRHVHIAWIRHTVSLGSPGYKFTVSLTGCTIAEVDRLLLWRKFNSFSVEICRSSELSLLVRSIAFRLEFSSRLGLVLIRAQTENTVQYVRAKSTHLA